MKQLGTDKNPFIFIVISMFFCPPLVAQSENPRDPQEHQRIAQGAAIFKKSCSVCPRSGVNSTSVLQEWAKKREVGAYILQQSVNFHRQGICPPHWWLE